MTVSERKATAVAHANIAFIKYWGNADEALRLPANPSLSMNLDGLYTETTVVLDENLTQDTLELNGALAAEAARLRVSQHLDVLREQLGIGTKAHVVSSNNFPMGAGIASSAAAFAALTVAGAAAAGANLDERSLSRIARRGSGSASRSIPAGFVEWHTGSDRESYAESIAAIDHWDLIDVIAVVSQAHKAVGSREGHTSALTSELQHARVATAPDRFQQCKQALLERDFATFAEVVEQDSNLMHAVMMTSKPPLFYWLPPSLSLMQAVREWRAEGLRVCYTLDAGPNVHCVCVRDDAEEVSRRAANLSGVQDVRTAGVGRGAYVVSK